MSRKIPYNSAEYIVKDSAGPKNEPQVKLGPTAAAPTFPFNPLPSVYITKRSAWDREFKRRLCVDLAISLSLRMTVGEGIHHGATQNGAIFSRFGIDKAVSLPYRLVIMSRGLKSVREVVLVAIFSLQSGLVAMQREAIDL